MKKHLLILAPVFLFAVFPVFAAQDGKHDNRGKGNKNDAAKVQEVVSVSASPSVAVSESPSESCDPNGTWKSHGQYVSCVSKQGRGGQAISEAARSDVGKKEKAKTPKPSGSPSIAPSASPSDVPSVTPSVMPSDVPSLTPSASPSVSLSPTPEGTTTVSTQQLQALITALEGIVNFLKNLL